MKAFFAVCFFALLGPATAWGQASSSTVRGTVRDQVQAVIPNAKVTLLNTATNASVKRASKVLSIRSSLTGRIS